MISEEAPTPLVVLDRRIRRSHLASVDRAPPGTVRFWGDLDRTVVDDLGTRLDAVEARPGTTVVVDLATVTFVDVAAARCLLAWAEATARRSVSVHLTGVPRLLPTIARLLGHDVCVVPDR
jgi:ABC-type transporter Mla MlaB component